MKAIGGKGRQAEQTQGHNERGGFPPPPHQLCMQPAIAILLLPTHPPPPSQPSEGKRRRAKASKQPTNRQPFLSSPEGGYLHIQGSTISKS